LFISFKGIDKKNFVFPILKLHLVDCQGLNAKFIDPVPFRGCLAIREYSTFVDSILFVT
jgi:hypothetical protein